MNHTFTKSGGSIGDESEALEFFATSLITGSDSIEKVGAGTLERIGVESDIDLKFYTVSLDYEGFTPLQHPIYNDENNAFLIDLRRYKGSANRQVLESDIKRCILLAAINRFPQRFQNKTTLVPVVFGNLIANKLGRAFSLDLYDKKLTSVIFGFYYDLVIRNLVNDIPNDPIEEFIIFGKRIMKIDSGSMDDIVSKPDVKELVQDIFNMPGKLAFLENFHQVFDSGRMKPMSEKVLRSMTNRVWISRNGPQVSSLILDEPATFTSLIEESAKNSYHKDKEIGSAYQATVRTHRDLKSIENITDFFIGEFS